jgi:alkanesulfonate monooxygenase SsuD/methylene tetrahydromethanopterin reductase-like flavin-dependent oxidoreductase (luciferase family)
LDHYSAGRLIVGVGIGGDWWREYSAVGEPADAKIHGALLDEGLEVLTKLWTGTPVTYHGTHYHLQDAHFLPATLQTPRIPIWVAGVWPGTRPFRRAAQWDGIVPTGRNGTPSPQEIREMRDYITLHRTATTSFEIVFQGRAHEVAEAERSSYIADYAAVGVTWWLESVWPDVALSKVQSIIQQGPPRP